MFLHPTLLDVSGLLISVSGNGAMAIQTVCGTWMGLLGVLLWDIFGQPTAMGLAPPFINSSYLPTGCTEDPLWFAPNLRKRDCFEAWSMLRTDLDRFGRGEFQFMHWGVRTSSSLPAEHPPIQYTHGTSDRFHDILKAVSDPELRLRDLYSRCCAARGYTRFAQTAEQTIQSRRSIVF